MNKIYDWAEIKFWEFAKYLIKRGYGADCETSDLDEFPEDYKVPKDVFKTQRCGSCRAKEVIDWIDWHIELIKYIGSKK